MKNFWNKYKHKIFTLLMIIYSIIIIGITLTIVAFNVINDDYSSDDLSLSLVSDYQSTDNGNLYNKDTFRNIYFDNHSIYVVASIPLTANIEYVLILDDLLPDVDTGYTINIGISYNDTDNYEYVDTDLYTELEDDTGELSISIIKDCYLYVYIDVYRMSEYHVVDEDTIVELLNLQYKYIPDQIIVRDVNWVPVDPDVSLEPFFPYDKDAALGKNLFNSYNNVNSDLVTGLFDLVDYNSVKSSINLYYNHSLLYPIPNFKCVLSFDLSFESKFNDLESVNFCVRYVNKDNLSEYVYFHNFEVLLNSKQHIEIPLESYDYFTIAYSNILDLGIYLISNIQLESGEVATAYEPFFSYNSIVEQEYNSNFQSSFNQGYDKGKEDGYYEGLNESATDKYDAGYLLGYNKGFGEGIESDFGSVFSKGIGAIGEFLHKLLDIEIWGTTLFEMVGSIGAVLVVLAVVRILITT